MPADTHMSVLYRSKADYHEDYDLVHPPTDNLAVCCRPGSPVEGKLPGVRCGLPATSDAAPPEEAGIRPDASFATEAGPDSSSLPETGTFPLEAGGASRDVALSTDSGSLRDSGSVVDGGGVEAILCELWTRGPAEIVVTGNSYPRLEKVLSVEQDECGIVTRDVRIIWSQRDGGQ